LDEEKVEGLQLRQVEREAKEDGGPGGKQEMVTRNSGIGR
jgi:hypothetical protein